MRKTTLAALAAFAMLVPSVSGPANAVTLNNGYGIQADSLAFTVLTASTTIELEKKLNDWTVQHKTDRIAGYEYSSQYNLFTVVISYWK